VGAILASASLGMLSYVFAMVTASTSRLRDPANIVLLSLAVILVPAFIFWVGRQERLNRPAIIPNSLWHNTVFTCICITVFLSWAVFNAFQFLVTLYFQDVQKLSAMQTSLRFLPMVVSGCLTNVGTGLLVQRTSAHTLVVTAAVITCASPVLMATINTNWPFWYAAFLATFFISRQCGHTLYCQQPLDYIRLPIQDTWSCGRRLQHRGTSRKQCRLGRHRYHCLLCDSFVHVWRQEISGSIDEGLQSQLLGVFWNDAGDAGNRCLGSEKDRKGGTEEGVKVSTALSMGTLHSGIYRRSIFCEGVFWRAI